MNNKLFTWGDVLEYLNKCTPAQLTQQVMMLPPQPNGDKPTGLQHGYCIDTVEKLEAKTRGCEDDAHHPEQIVILIDWFPFDKDGNFYYILADKGMIGNKTGKLYENPAK